MKITRLYVDDNGETHFTDIDVEWASSGVAGQLSDRIPVKSLWFRRVQADYDYDWHNAPRKQYIINLDASVEITVSDGEKRVIGPGEVFLVEDTHGKGHISKAVGGKIRHCLFVGIEE